MGIGLKVPKQEYCIQMCIMLRRLLILLWAQRYSDYSLLYASRFLCFGDDWDAGSRNGMFDLNVGVYASYAIDSNVGSISMLNY